MRVLVVEDHRDLVEILLEGLRAEGMAVDAAATHDPCLAAVSTSPSHCPFGASRGWRSWLPALTNTVAC